MKGLIVYPVVWEHLCGNLTVPILFPKFPMEPHHPTALFIISIMDQTLYKETNTKNIGDNNVGAHCILIHIM
jgi:hypothetical protein